MTRTLFAFAPPTAGLRVTITTQPASDDGAILCQGAFATPFGTVVAFGAGGALWGLGLTGEMSEDEVRADLQARGMDDAAALRQLLAQPGPLPEQFRLPMRKCKVWRGPVSRKQQRA